MFKSILIANRGEIACRVMQTAEKLGIETIAIYSTADKDSLHAQKASKAFWVGEAPSQASYLNIDAIIRIAKESNAEAIHPGYGFLSENPAFAKACEKAGIVFIGPSVSAMESMASKQLAKKLLEHSNVPLTPGYHGAEQAPAHLLYEAKQIGFPVLLKAANGGGGKGMRAVYHEDEFEQALAAAKRESMASFADETMIIEKLIVNPRHVEIQIMADNHGNVVHLFERDCSIQRRHQKIIEEAPAPLLSASLRKALAHSACEVAKAIDYRGAGTVEFLVSDDDQFYFMEMNTRLQVEHPVTEMITGIDLVAWQILVAAGRPLPLAQKEILSKGHAIECRIYAEDAYHGFIPSIGEIDHLEWPTTPGVRIDTGVQLQSHITQYYDPMIAKLIIWGQDRAEAIQRLNMALSTMMIGGVKTNIPFLQAICQHHSFIQTKLSTHFLTNEHIELPTPDSHKALMMAVAFDYLMLTQQQDPIDTAAFAWHMHLPSSWKKRYIIQGELMVVEISPTNRHQLSAIIQGKTHHLAISLTQNQIHVDDGKQKYSAPIQQKQDQLIVYLNAIPVTIDRFEWQQEVLLENTLNNQLTAPMHATIAAILKKQGDVIKKGDQLLILEAMKMEHTIHAPKDGIVGELFYAVGAQVDEGAELLSLIDTTEA